MSRLHLLLENVDGPQVGRGATPPGRPDRIHRRLAAHGNRDSLRALDAEPGISGPPAKERVYRGCSDLTVSRHDLRHLAPRANMTLGGADSGVCPGDGYLRGPAGYLFALGFVGAGGRAFALSSGDESWPGPKLGNTEGINFPGAGVGRRGTGQDRRPGRRSPDRSGRRGELNRSLRAVR